jgi:hypothetical protein
MIARPGRIQSTFSAGEVAPSFYGRTEQKAYAGGLKHMENVEIVPQGGFRLAPRFVHIGDVAATAARVLPFDASNGTRWDVVLSAGAAAVWGTTAAATTLAIPHDGDQVAAVGWTQRLDELYLFHRDVVSKQILVAGPTAGPWTWSIADLPFENIPNWDYGGVYTNGVAAVWEIDLVGFKPIASTLPVDEITFQLTVSKQETGGLTPVLQSGSTTAIDGAATAAVIQAAILALPNVKPGVTVTAIAPTYGTSWTKYDITFAGAGNEGDGWAVSGQVLNKADAAVPAYRKVVGVEPGEPIMSSTRGWPGCGAIVGQRLLIGGFKSLPNAWAYSIEGLYCNFDERIDEANGAAVVPMDLKGGEEIRGFFWGRNLCIFTSFGEYWLADRAIDKTKVPNHVQSSQHGSAAGIPMVENEGAALYVQDNRGVVGEYVYTDVTGNFKSQDLTLLASHLMVDLRDQAIRRATGDGDGNRHVLVRGDGMAVWGTLLREQEITGYARLTTDGAIRAACVNGRNEVSVLVDRVRDGATVRTLERLSREALLDGAITLSNTAPTITGLSRLEGATVWVIGDGDVFGPYTVTGGAITTTKGFTTAVVGRWTPPRVETLPLGRMAGPEIWVQRPARIHSVQILVEDTTSIAVGIGGGRTYDIDLRRYGETADVAELASGYTGWVKVRGLKGYSDQPTVVITQHRPGRLDVKSIVTETNLGS